MLLVDFQTFLQGREICDLLFAFPAQKVSSKNWSTLKGKNLPTGSRLFPLE